MLKGDADLYADLGSGVRYGSFAISTSLLPDEQVLWTLDGAAFLADLNAAIDGEARYFAIGGTLSFAPTAAPTNTVPDRGNTLGLLGLAVACLWSVRRRKQAD